MERKLLRALCPVLCAALVGCSSDTSVVRSPDARPLLVEVCGNGLDDDLNGLTDCEDPACITTPACNVCGDGKALGHEECDGADLRGRTCADFGYLSGQLSCLPACVYDLTACTSGEICDNHRDDNGDGLVDCADPMCIDTPACAVCGDGRVSGNEQCDDGNQTAGDCCDHCRAEPGCEIEPNDANTTATEVDYDNHGVGAVDGWVSPSDLTDYYFLDIPAGYTAEITVNVTLVDADIAQAGMGVALERPDGSIRAAGGLLRQGSTEFDQPLFASGVAPGRAYLHVQTGNLSRRIHYHLAIQVALDVCGDRTVQLGQECDDGNVRDGDGCTASCTLEIPAGLTAATNSTTAKNPATVPFAVEAPVTPVFPTMQEDWYAVRLTKPGNIDAEVIDARDADCTSVFDQMSVAIFARDDKGNDVPISDASGNGPQPTTGWASCGRVTSAGKDLKPDLDPGVYYVRVSGALNAALPPGQAAPPYRLIVRNASVCGNGIVEGGEECDGTPGCSSICTLSVCGNGRLDAGEECDDSTACCQSCKVPAGCEREPNDDSAHATGPLVLPVKLLGTLAPTTPADVDFYSFSLNATADVRVTTGEVPGCFGLPGEVVTISGAGFGPLSAQADKVGCLTLRATLPAGRYTVEVADADVASADKFYEVDVSFDSTCGDGQVTGTETCDDTTPACLASACGHTAKCGDGIISGTETCDDGNLVGGDGCEADCTPTVGPYCGNGHTDGGEQCDDGNRIDGDCCSSHCLIEPGCEVEPNDTAAQANGPYTVPVVIQGLGGSADGKSEDTDFYNVRVLDAGDVTLTAGGGGGGGGGKAGTTGGGGGCNPGPVDFLALRGGGRTLTAARRDDGCVSMAVTLAPGLYSLELHVSPGGLYALSVDYQSRCGDLVVSGTETCDDNSQACRAVDCRHVAVCGDGIVTGLESCDDGNTTPGDGCSATCDLEHPLGICGDHHVDPGEECDDGNLLNGDGCSATCKLEPKPPVCGDGHLDPGEDCDDGNVVSGDGCSATCKIEPGNAFESEPNDDGTPSVANSDFRAANANGPFSQTVVIHAAISPAGDDDGFAVLNPGATAVQVTAAAYVPAVGSCVGEGMELRLRDSVAALRAFASTPVDGACAKLDFTVNPGEVLYVVATDAGDNSVIPAYQLSLTFH
jgi:cysteine-rich repeat protein